MSARPRPVLVTGLPRSGTTWLAQQLASGPHMSLPGREPMNPRRRQFALQGTLQGWTRLPDPPPPRQARALRRAYRGWEPRTYSRYGRHRPAGPWPWTHVVVKDPYALLSLPAVCGTTRARPVVLYRHPGALLASFRRMGWSPDVAEVRALALPDLEAVPPPPVDEHDEVAAMGWFWAACYATVLHDLPRLPEAVVVDHAALAGGGPAALRTLAGRLGLPCPRPGPAHARPYRRWHRPARRADSGAGARPVLHHLDRPPAQVAGAWQRHVAAADIARLEELTAPVHAALTAVSLVLPAPDRTSKEEPA